MLDRTDRDLASPAEHHRQQQPLPKHYPHQLGRLRSPRWRRSLKGRPSLGKGDRRGAAASATVVVTTDTCGGRSSTRTISSSRGQRTRLLRTCLALWDDSCMLSFRPECGQVAIPHRYRATPPPHHTSSLRCVLLRLVLLREVVLVVSPVLHVGTRATQT